MQIAAVEPVGIAAASRDGRICVALPTDTVAPGTTVTLIRPDPPQATMIGTIDGEMPRCERLERASISGPYFLFRASSSTASGSGNPWAPWLAFPGEIETGTTDNGNVTVAISRTFQAAQVRVCTSGEGAHLTVWSGTPLGSTRLWHQYYYLGYDVEPSCDELDFQ
jgi:hypothetical protein